VHKNPIRIKDIALKAEVSVGTVDRVLHNRGRVSEEVRQRILRIVEEMNYEPNLLASALGSNRLYRLAALLPDPALDPYWLEPRAGIEKAQKEFSNFGVAVTLYRFNQYQPSSFIEKANEVTRSQPDGILLAPLFYRESLPFFSQWETLKIPFVLFNTQITQHSPLSYIGQDSFQSGLLAGKLLHYGIQEPATVLIVHIAEDISNSAHLIKKEQGFRDYFLRNTTRNETAASSFKVVSADLRNPGSPSFARQLDHLLDEHADLKGIYVTTSKAYEIATYLQVYHRENIRLVGYDLLERNVHFLQEGVIDFLINQNPKGMGYWGITHLVDFLAFKKKIPAIKHLPLDVIVKENLEDYLNGE
jgi:LacI family transcriptional regulator